MIKLFGTTDRDFSSNGDIVLQPLRARVKKEDNGSFYLDLETGLEYINDLTDGRIIVANTPQGDQPFRISGVEKTRSKIKLKANHVFYDSANYLIEDSYVVNRSCLDALDHLNSATEPTSPFTMISDISVTNTYRCVRESLYTAIKTVLERWGGHLVRNGWTVGIYSSIGTDNGVEVRYAKNLKDISVTTDWTDVVTKLLPVGADGLMLPEVYLEAPIQYDIPYTKTVSFQQSLEREEYESDEEFQQALVSDLRQQATEYLEANDVPKVNYSLSANLERITDIGDVVVVRDERLGINIMTNVISYEYDCILGGYTILQFGNFKQSLSGFASSFTNQTRAIIDEETENIRVVLSQELEQATSQIWGVLGNSYVIYDGDKILVLDRLPKESAVNVMMINAGGIGFSTSGINGTFNSAWTIDGTLNMQNINVIGTISASLIKGGTLKLGGADSNMNGVFELYDAENNLIGIMDSDGLKMYGQDGSYVLINQTVGFAGYDRNDNAIYWVNGDEFHMKKSVIEEEITLCNKMRFIPISLYNGSTLINDGIGLVSVIGDVDGGYEPFIPSGSDGLTDANDEDFLVIHT